MILNRTRKNGHCKKAPNRRIIKLRLGAFIMSKTRNYTHIDVVKNEVLNMLAQGKTQREVAEIFGFRDKYVVKGFVKRHARKMKKLEAGITLRPKGRPRKNTIPVDILKEKEYEIKRLKMENELLQNFLSVVGRR